QIAVDAQALTLGTPANGSLNGGHTAYYKVVVSAGQTLRVVLAGQNPTASNELYLSYQTMPTRSQYDARYSQAASASQQITIPNTQAGAYYILAAGGGVAGGSDDYALTASLIPFSVQAVSPAQVGAGPVTLQIIGADF